MAEPIPVRVTRYRCPHCARSHSSKTRCREHMGRCWDNPDARGCKTCAHFTPAEDGPYREHPGWPEGCAEGISLAGRPQCDRCGGFGDIPVGDIGHFGHSVMPNCEGDGREVKPGPIVHCELWEPDTSVSGPAGAAGKEASHG